MSYVLYGSETSPFVRRTRMVMEPLKYDFKVMNIFEGADKTELNRINPINQIPVLKDGDQTIWDSRVIFNYLNQKHHLYKMDWKSENILTAIDGATSSGVPLILMKRSGFDINTPLMYLDRQKERMESILDFLRPEIQTGQFKEWNILSMSLYTFLDWASFRGLIKLDQRPDFIEFMKRFENLPVVKLTQIPRT